jgi:hypothetical protein
VRADADGVVRARQVLDELEQTWRGRVERMADLAPEPEAAVEARGAHTMSVTSIDTDYDNLTTTLVADFDAPIDEVWELWADPRKLEQWWGPPTYPATVEEHDPVSRRDVARRDGHARGRPGVGRSDGRAARGGEAFVIDSALRAERKE